MEGTHLGRLQVKMQQDGVIFTKQALANRWVAVFDGMWICTQPTLAACIKTAAQELGYSL